ncbi:MAG: branched-chain amino acid transaminase [Chloroflexota bacterium]|nr:branched-chain amino acid transaminase [Chloroflexota bacterium]|tara:strand:- start:455 stop:1372 length:918 start_codon:yes stop_codon:yes gene_type:complete
MPALAFFEGEIVPLEEAKISVVTHAFNYGTGVFEGIRGNWNEDKDELYLFRVKEHYERLYRSCKMINIDLRYNLDQLEEMTLDLVKSCGYKEDIYVRPLAYKSGDLVGLRVHDIPDDFLIYVVPFGNYLESDKGITCSFSSFLRVEDSMIPPSAKVTGMYVNNSLAKSEAVWRGFDEAIMLTRDGFISEGSGENIFLVKDGVVYTPQITDHILEGLTRNTLIELCKNELGIEVVERRIPKSDVVVADEFFMTGTAAHVTPVLSVDGRDIGDGSIGPITSKLQKLYFDIVKGKNSKYSDWLSPVFS